MGSVPADFWGEGRVSPQPCNCTLRRSRIPGQVSVVVHWFLLCHYHHIHALFLGDNMPLHCVRWRNLHVLSLGFGPSSFASSSPCALVARDGSSPIAESVGFGLPDSDENRPGIPDQEGKRPTPLSKPFFRRRSNKCSFVMLKLDKCWKVQKCRCKSQRRGVLVMGASRISNQS